MKQFLFLSIAALILVGCQENKTNSKNKSSEWISLFDGSSLDGWKAYNEESLPPGWAIIDSVMTFSTEMILEQDYDYKGSRDIIYGAQKFDNFEHFDATNLFL